MTFRWRVSLFFVSLLIVALLLQFALGFVLFRSALFRDLQNDLSRHAVLLSEHMEVTAEGVILDDEGRDDLESLHSYADGRARVLDVTGQHNYSLGVAFPEDTSAWLVKRFPLHDDYTLELAMNPRVHNSALSSYWQASAIGVPLLSLVLIGITLFLSQRLVRPLRKLQDAVTHVSESADLTRRVPELTTQDELGHLSRSYNKMMTRLEQFVGRERNFTRYASHELRNPLTALRVQVDAALLGDVPHKTVLPVLKRELHRLSSILDSLLILSRDQAIPNTPIDLAVLARESLDRSRVLAADKPLVIDYQGPKTVPFCGDKALLSRLLDNLLENAVKYSQAGEIVLRLEQAPNVIKVRVTDPGEGVPSEHLAKLTTPFFRAMTEQGHGVGLGLSVVQHVAKAHAGALCFENLEPTGFAVMVKFPRCGV